MLTPTQKKRTFSYEKTPCYVNIMVDNRGLKCYYRGIMNVIENNSENSPDLQSICEIQDIQLQRWVNINISLSNKILDVFINGNLVKTHIINGYPKPNVGSINICKDGGYNGFLSKLAFTNKALSITEIQHNYKKGPDI